MPRFAVERRRLKPPSLAGPKPPKPKPAALEPPPSPFERLGPWAIIHRDALGKRAVAQCAYCLTIKEIGIADGCIASCGCNSGRTPSAKTFAAGIAGTEAHVAVLRHRGRR
jgi:hypothetical protein